MKKYKINEIFQSIQGEGRFTGHSAIFIRFAGCNLNCSFCDTEFETYKEYNAADILAKINMFNSDIIVLTGGEPALQVDAELLQVLRLREKIKIHIETNGTINLSPWFNWVTVSPKNKTFKQISGGELKLLYDGTQDLDFYYINTTFREYYLQPLMDENYEKNLQATIKAIKNHSEWHLSLQIHKLINIK